jgi:hypothetical protein
MPPVKSYDVQQLGSRLLRFTRSVNELVSPDEVLDNLHHITLDTCQLNVLAATMFPLRWGDPAEKGRTCQSARNFDPQSASNLDPHHLRAVSQIR